jgi:general secretion pathway protein K
MNAVHFRVKESGAALVLVIWVVMLLSLLVMGIALTMQVETKLASLNRTKFKCDVLARAGIELAKQQLMADIDPTQDTGADAFKEKWCTNPDLYENYSMGDGVINVKVSPEDGKLNINTLSATPEALRYFFQLLQVQPADLDVLVDSIQDWVDTDDNARINGAEVDYYSRLAPPYRPKNGPIDRLEELLLVRGMTPDLFYGRTSGHPLRESLTGLSAGKVNVNVAPAIVLAVLLGIEESQAEQIVTYRNGDDGAQGTDDDRVFYSRQDLPLASSSISAAELKVLQNVLDFKSYFFTIVSEGRIGNVSKTIRVTVSRDQDGIKTLAWLEGADALR